jgi:hypothetical protein
LNIAAWAKYLAWVALIFAFILPVARYVGIQNVYRYQSFMTDQTSDFVSELKANPMYAISVIVDTFNSFLAGFIYFLVLRGISLGLNMIVETDINYREQKQQGGEK